MIVIESIVRLSSHVMVPLQSMLPVTFRFPPRIAFPTFCNTPEPETFLWPEKSLLESTVITFEAATVPSVKPSRYPASVSVIVTESIVILSSHVIVPLKSALPVTLSVPTTVALPTAVIWLEAEITVDVSACVDVSWPAIVVDPETFKFPPITVSPTASIFPEPE